MQQGNIIIRAFRQIGLAAALAVMVLPSSVIADTSKPGKSADYPLRIDVKKSVDVSGDTIFLKHIAKLTGNPVLREKAGEIRINATPRPGEDKAIAASRIVSIVRSKRWLPDNIRIAAPAYVFVRRLSQALPAEILRDRFEAYVKEKDGDGRIEINDFKIIGNTILPDGKLSFDFPEYDKPMMKRVSLNVAVAVDGAPAGSVTLSAWVNRYAPVVTVRHRMRRGSILSGEDLCMTEMNIAKAPSNLVTDKPYARGKRLSCDLMPGAYLRDNMLSVPYLIHRGDRIKIIAENRYLKVITTGIARDDGRKNDQIKVENISSGQVIAARVADGTSVKVNF
ncbi:MAG: flagellar basal body P-ring formation chaperone FlgA [Thermodesulfobacteriota bacterium]|nr:flagellar basal body P-ring formation chaperone FlgA [Thermodesulfobacteriota bacterium]